MGYITGMVIVATITLGIYKLFELFVCKRERLTFIEKISSGVDPSLITSLKSAFKQSNQGFSSLRLGSLLLGMGAGLLLGFFICCNVFPEYRDISIQQDWRTEARMTELSVLIYGACVLTCGGLGLLSAFLLELKLSRKQDNQLPS